MAEGGPPPELDFHFLECPICLERLRQPKSLPCLHCFCQECLGTYITKELSGKMVSATSFPCPVCRRMTSPVNQAEAKEKWAEQFPTNAVIQELIQLKVGSSEPLYCKPCQTRGNLTIPAKFWCKTMDVKFCETCKIQHHDIMHNDCDILNITGYDSRKKKQEKSAPKCDQHDEKLVWYCEDHKYLGGNICVFKDHRRCEEVSTATEYFQMLKTGSQLADMQAALKNGAEVMDSLVKDFDEQLQTMIQNQEIALQSITDLRQKVDKRLDKLQKDVTDKLVMLFKEEKGNMEVSSRQCERLMNSMLNTWKSSVTVVEGNDAIEMVVLYQRGQAEVESCKALVTEMRKSFTSVSINHHIVPRLVTIGDEAMGKIVFGKQPRCIPGSQSGSTYHMSDRRVKEIGKFKIKSPSDKERCFVCGVVCLPSDVIVVSDQNNNKLKLFTDKGQYLDELTTQGYPYDLCLVNNNTVAVAVYSPGGVRVVKVEDSKLSLSSEINMPNGNNCLGITHRDGRFIVGTDEGEVYSVTHDGTAELLYKYNNNCWSLTQDPVKGDTLVSVNNDTTGDVAVSRLSAEKRHTDVMKVGVVRGAVGIDVDREGNIYVCGDSSHNVVQMSGDGTHVRELLTSSDGMIYPWAIAVRGDRFFVSTISGTDDNNYIRVFQLY
ncbi:E3 ubiquitin/ISG15 ligase TRIM25-like [Mizuhopecten yessoensis]|uniref:E3 ubiquitin/ISG15 ligase TRIM25-like n=1 Tax=Mizuhopecten yessoensis TaxID=6573 RepID=UPI000B45E8A4|nr:E3 ubiquitin/ISG15 ligase TRIM25-like [Mizuhopecten yessoensis]